MFRRSTWLRFKIAPPSDVRGASLRGGGASHAKRATRFAAPEGPSRGRHSDGAPRPKTYVTIPPTKNRHTNASVARPLRDGESGSPGARATLSHSPHIGYGGATASGGGPASQRQRYREQQAASGGYSDDPSAADAPSGSFLSPLPKKYGFYDGVDEHGLEAARPSPAMRQRMLRQALEEQAASVLEVTDGGEADIELGGLPASEFHGQEGWTTIPRDSALYSSVLAREELESRARTNSWSIARRGQAPAQGTSPSPDQPHQQIGASRRGAGTSVGHLMGEYAAAASANEAGESVVLDDVRRRRHSDEGGYTATLEGELLEPTAESVGPPRSVYGLRKMFVSGLLGYQGMVSRQEEADIAEELLRLLQDPRAAYVAEETRYCVNLYETELGLPGKDTLAFPIARAPTLQRVLYRFFYLGLIPSPPNVVQVSEMIGNFSGYPVHRKPRAIGSYVGLLNLVSTSVMHLQHVDCPWYPRVHLSPRSLYVITEPCLSEYAMGYKQTHQPFHAFEYATRVSKDYRIEVLFATVETQHMRHLNEAVQLTDYALEKAASLTEGGVDVGAVSPSAAGAAPLPPSSMDAYLERLRAQVHEAAEGTSNGTSGQATGRPHNGTGGDLHRAAIVDGHALREQLLRQGAVGSKPQQFMTTMPTAEGTTTHSADGGGGVPPARPASAAQRRLAALKARHSFAKQLKAAEAVTKGGSSHGPRLIRGHAPGDRK